MARTTPPDTRPDAPGAPADPGVERALTRPDRAGPEEAGPPVLTLGEVAGVAGVVTFAAIAVASLALAQLGAHDGRVAVVLGLAATAVVAVPAWRIGPRPRVRVDRLELALVGGAMLAASFFFLPGFPYAAVDKDPGVYVAHAFAIARTGDVTIPAPVLGNGLNPQFSPAGLFPGVWVESRHPPTVTSQFYHLFSATLATADDLVGSRGVFNLTPLLGIASVGLMVIAIRRATSTAASVVFALLFVTSMMQVWQARYPSTEGLAQFLLAGALLGGVLAVERGWAGGALAAGLLLGVGFLCRPDGFLYIVLAAGVAGFVVAAGRADRRLAMLGVGLALTFPYAAWNAYEARLIYTASNSVPRLPTLIAVCALLVLAGLPVRALAGVIDRRRARRGGPDPDAPGDPDAPRGLLGLLHRWRLPLGILASVGSGLVLLGLWHRQTLLGRDYVYSPFVGRVIPSLDELNIKWLSWFITMRGLVLMWLGIVVVALTRVRAATYLLVLTGGVLLPVYLWDARISMRLMWWVRRFTPAVMPAVFLLIALAIAWALLHRYRPLRVLGALVAASLVVSFAHQSLWLRGHHEMGGSWESAKAIAAFAGDRQGVFLYTASDGVQDPMRTTPAAVWWIFDQVTARLQPTDGIAQVDQYQRAFPGQPVFLVTSQGLPPQLPRDRFTRAGEVTQRLSMWEEAQSAVPNRAISLTNHMQIWRLDG
ncbi:MAG TPA: hypothetical protein VKB57_03280 [Acidimicrobiales bacterium]|nr:hypothetical protein [Acidimicrobiales bacterium]